MPSRSVLVGAARVNFSADDAEYQRIVSRVQGGHRRLEASYRGVGDAATRANRTIAAFTTSVQSSIIATSAYFIGVEGLRRVIGGSVEAFADWETGLIAVQKTTGLADAQIEQLSGRFETLLTQDEGALPVTAESLLGIAEAAGQMNIQGTSAIETFSETVSQLTLTTDLAAEDSARALGLIINNTRAAAEEAGAIGSVLTALGNQFRGGERDIINIAENIARSTSAYDLPAESLLAFSAVFSQVGARAETTGTVIQRSLQALVDAAGEAASGDLTKLATVADAAGVSVERLRGAIETGDFTLSLRLLGDALSNLPNIGSDREVSRSNLLTLLFGGESPPTRIAEILGVLATQAGEVDRALEIANAEWREQIALQEEFDQAAAASTRRFQVVSNEIHFQGEALGSVLTPALLGVAENFRVVEVAAAGIGTALAVSFGARRLDRVRQFNAELTGQLAREVYHTDLARRSAAANAATAAANQAASAPFGLSGIQRLAVAERTAEANRRARVAVEAHATAQRNLARATTLAGRAGRIANGVFNFFGGGLGLIAGGLALGATALTVWGRNADTATKSTEEFFEALRAASDALEADASPLTAEGQQLAQARGFVDAIRAEIERIENAPRVGPAAILGDGPPEAFRLGPLRERLEQYEAELRRFEGLQNAALDDAGNDAADALQSRLEGLQDDRTSLEASLAERLQAQQDVEGGRIEDLAAAAQSNLDDLEAQASRITTLLARPDLTRGRSHVDLSTELQDLLDRRQDIEAQISAAEGADIRLRTSDEETLRRRLDLTSTSIDRQMQHIARLEASIAETEETSAAAIAAFEAQRPALEDQAYPPAQYAAGDRPAQSAGGRSLQSIARSELRRVDAGVAMTEANASIRLQRLADALEGAQADLTDLQQTAADTRVSLSLIDDAPRAGATSSITPLQHDLILTETLITEVSAAITSIYEAGGRGRAELEESLRANLAERQELEGTLMALSMEADRGSDQMVAATQTALDAVNADIAETEEQLAALGGAASLVGAAFEKIDLSIAVPEREVAAFAAQLRDSTKQEIASAETRVRLAEEALRLEGATVLERETALNVIRLTDAESNRIADRRLMAARKLADAERDVQAAQNLVLQAQTLEDLTAVNTKAREEATRQREEAEKQLVTQQALLETLRAQLLASGQLTVNAQLIRRLAVVRAQATVAEDALDDDAEDPFTVSLSFPDPVAQAREVERFSESLQREVDQQARNVQQARVLAFTVGDEERAGLAARLDIENRILDQQTVAAQRLTDARRELADSAEAIIAAQERLASATGLEAEAAQELLETSQQRQADAETAVANAEEFATATNAARDELSRFADQAEAIGRSSVNNAFERLAENVATLEESLEGAAANALTNFGEELSQIVSTGTVEWGRLADAIISDLIRAGVQAVVTANLLRAVGFVSGSIFGGGAAAAGPGAGPPIRGVFHEGGIAGYPAQLHAGALRGNEVVAVLERGEEVLTGADPRHRHNIAGQTIADLRSFAARLPRFHDGGVVGGGAAGAAAAGGLRVEIINRSSQPVEAVDNGQRVDIDGLVTSVVLRDVARVGTITQAMRARLGGGSG